MSESIANEPELLDVEEATTAVVAGIVNTSELPAFFDQTFSTLPGVLAAQGLQPVGPAFALHRRVVTDTADLEVGLPTDRPVEAQGDVRPSLLPGGRIARAVHHGSFDGLPDAWARLDAWITAQGLTPHGSVWEVYLTEPSPDMDPADLRTELNWPVR